MVAVGPVPFPEPSDDRSRPSLPRRESCLTVGGLDQSGLDDAPLELLERSLKLGWAEQTAHLARWLAVLAVFDRREGWAGWGIQSCAHWLSIHCGISTVTAGEHVRVARRLEGLPRVAAAFAGGRLSYSKVRAVCRVATPDTEEDLVELALDTTASQLERVLRIAERQRRGDGLDEDEKEERRSVHVWTDDDGMGRLEVIAHPEEIAVLRAAIDFGRENLYRGRCAEAKAAEAGGGEHAGGPEGAGGEKRVRVEAPSRVDSLLWTVQAGLDRLEGDPGYAPPSPYLVMINVREASAMVGDDGRVEVEGGLRIHPRRLRQLACDATVRLLMQGRSDEEGSPLDVGRAKRTITDRQRAALLAVHDTCNVDGCHVPSRFCQWHHVDDWIGGGPTDRVNLRPVCRRHHSLAHKPGTRLVIGPAGYLVLLRADETQPTRPSFGELATTRAELDADALVACNVAAGVEIDPDADVDNLTARWGGEPLTPFATDVIVHNLCRLFDGTEQGDTGGGSGGPEAGDAGGGGPSGGPSGPGAPGGPEGGGGPGGRKHHRRRRR